MSKVWHNGYMIKDATSPAEVTELAAAGDPAALWAVRDYRMYALYKKEKRMMNPDAIARAILDASDVNVAGKLSPPGTCVLSVKRIGDIERDLYLERLHEGHAKGCISRDIFDVRLAAMMAATVKDELEYLVKDLPDPPPAPRPKHLTSPGSNPLFTLKKIPPSWCNAATFFSITLFLVAAVWTMMTLGWFALGVTLVAGAISAWFVAG